MQEDIGETAQNRIMTAVEGLLSQAYYELAIGQDDRYAGFKLLAGKIYSNYETKVAGFQGQARVGLPPFADINRRVLNRLLDPATRNALRRARRAPHAAATAPGICCHQRSACDDYVH